MLFTYFAYFTNRVTTRVWSPSAWSSPLSSSGAVIGDVASPSLVLASTTAGWSRCSTIPSKTRTTHFSRRRYPSTTRRPLPANRKLRHTALRSPPNKKPRCDFLRRSFGPTIGYVSAEWLERCVAFCGKLIAELRSITYHVGSHSVTCHPTQVSALHLNPSLTVRYSIYLPIRDGRLS